MRVRLTTHPVLGYTKGMERVTLWYEHASYSFYEATYRLAIIPFVAFEWKRRP